MAVCCYHQTSLHTLHTDSVIDRELKVGPAESGILQHRIIIISVQILTKVFRLISVMLILQLNNTAGQTYASH
jgi:hypothetical protein